MSALVVDSSSWISYFDGGAGDSLIDDALAEGRVWLPPVVVAELLSGRMSSRQRREIESLLADLPLCALDFPHWVRVGLLRATLLAKGVSISTPDAHVAQCALDLGALLLSEDGIFGHVARLVPLRLVAPGSGPPDRSP
ncbi:MAG: PIN domain-containing protein [Myxococcales bacterium]|nr:PIN domain-containing protein [Myxococcales bacterium]